MPYNHSNVKWNNTGRTLMDQKRMSVLMDQVGRCRNGVQISLYDLIPEDETPLGDVPIRTAANAPEYYGGMRMDGVRGNGDTVCRTENMPHVYNEVLRSMVTHVEDIVSFAAMDMSNVVIQHDSYLLNRFLDIFDQPVPFDKNRAAARGLDIPDTKADYMSNGISRFQYDGRDPVWARGLMYAGMEWENKYKAKKREEMAALEEKRRAEWQAGRAKKG